MCCEDPPPDLNLIGPPPKPPWLSYSFECDHEGGIVQLLPHEGQTSALPNSSGGRDLTDVPISTIPTITSPNSHNEDPYPTTWASTNTFVHHTTSGNSFPTTSSEETTLTAEQNVTSSILSTTEEQGNEQHSASEALFSNSTVNVVAIVLFCLAVIILAITLFVIYHRRKLLQKQQVNHGEGEGEAPDEYQYLYNYKVRGKLWRFPRVSLVLRSKLGRKYSSKKKEKGGGQDDTSGKGENKENVIVDVAAAKETYKTDTLDTGYGEDLSMTNLDRIYEANIVDNGNPRSANSNYRFNHSQHSKPYSSLERGSSTTSGFSSDGGEWRYQDDSGVQFFEEDAAAAEAPHRTRRLRRKGQRGRHNADDGELGDAEGSMECLAPQDKKLYQSTGRTTQHHKRHHKPPRIPSTEDDVLFIKHHQPDTTTSSTINNKRQRSTSAREASPPNQHQKPPARARRKTCEFKIAFPPPPPPPPPDSSEQLTPEGPISLHPKYQTTDGGHQTDERLPHWAAGGDGVLLRERRGERGRFGDGGGARRPVLEPMHYPHHQTTSSGLPPPSLPLNEEQSKQKKKKKKKRAKSASRPGNESHSVEALDNMDNELKESYA